MEEAIQKGYDFAEDYFVKGAAGRVFYAMRFYSGDEFRVSCFCGIAAEEYSGDRSTLQDGFIPESKYAVFRYPGIMALVFRTVMEDLSRWLSVSEFELNDNTGIDMFALQTEDYEQTGKFYLYVPVL